MAPLSKLLELITSSIEKEATGRKIPEAQEYTNNSIVIPEKINNVVAQPTSSPTDPYQVDLVIGMLRPSLFKTDLSVVAICGNEGMGKTCLARTVFQDRRIREQFRYRAWASMSDKTINPRKTLAQLIVSSGFWISSDYPADVRSISDMDTLRKILIERPSSERWLIVLDNLQIDLAMAMSKEWQKLMTTIESFVGRESCLVTTGNSRISPLFSSQTWVEHFDISDLRDDEFWRLFRQFALGDADDVDPELERMGRFIAKRLNRVPLAAKVLGVALRAKPEKQYWKEVLLESKLWQAENISPALELCYHHLPAHLKQCFVYCSLFPKGYKLCKERIVQMWISQGFVQPTTESATIEDVGAGYFDELLARCFIEEDASGGYVLHGLLYDIARSISAQEYLRIDEPLKLKGDLRMIRHANIRSIYLGIYLDRVKYEWKNLRTLVISYPLPTPRIDWLVTELELVLVHFTDLLVLVVEDVVINRIPYTIYHLRNLSYFEFRYAEDTLFPPAVSYLDCLRYLRMDKAASSYSPPHLPEIFNRLRDLRRIDGDAEIHRSIAGIGRLTSLQELPELRLDKDLGIEIGELKDLRELRGHLVISNLQNISSKTEAMKAELGSKQYLESLDLCWDDGRVKHENGVLEGLCPHPNLKSLRILNYNGLSSPTWLEKKMLPNIRILRLDKCHFWRELPTLGQLPFLETLMLINMRGLKRWVRGSKRQRLFPSLKQITIAGCPNLGGTLPIRHPPPYLDITIDGRKIISEDFPNTSQESCSSSALHVYMDRVSLLTKGIPGSCRAFVIKLQFKYLDIKTFTYMQTVWIGHLTSLKFLSFSNMKQLQHVPPCMRFLRSLEVIEVSDCYRLGWRRDIKMPKSLKIIRSAGQMKFL